MKNILVPAVVVFFVAVIYSSVMALGVGVYGEVQRGSTRYGSDFNGNTGDIGAAGGFVLDTNVAKNSLFNYRLRIGAGQVWSGDVTFTRASVIQTFGLSPAMFRGSTVRFWLGPRIGLHYLNAEINELYDTSMSLLAIYSGLPYLAPRLNIRLNAFKGDIGFVLAAFNFNFEQAITLSFEFGFNVSYMIGRADCSTEWGAPARKWITATGEGIEGFAAMAVLFRVNDNYSGAVPQALPVETEMQEKM